MRTAPWAWLLLLVLTSAGCGFLEFGSGASSEGNRCVTTADCGSGYCDLLRSRCVEKPEEAFQLSLELLVADPVSGTSSSVSLAPFVLSDASTNRTLQLPGRVRIFGKVRQDGQVVAAELRFVRKDEGVFVHSPLTPTTTSPTPSSDTLDGQPADYALQLLSGATYEVTVEPAGEARYVLPPLRASVSIPEGDAQRLDFEYPALSDFDDPALGLLTLEGRLIDIDGKVQEDMRVRAIDRVDGRAASSIGITDAQGQFTIRTSEALTDVILRVSPTPEASSAVLPTFEVDPRYLLADAQGRYDILAPSVDSVHLLTGTVTGNEDDTDEMMVGALLDFRSVDLVDDATGIAFSHEVTTGTDSDGEFEAQLFAGSYELAITPSDDGPLGPFATRITVGAATTERTFQLPSRSVHMGMVQEADGVGVADAEIRALAVRQSSDDDEISSPSELAARYNRPSTTLTDAAGAFSVRLDTGVYDIVAEPPQEMGFPWSILREFTAETTSSVPKEIALALRSPVTLDGTVVDAGGAALAGVEIRAYVLFERDGETISRQIGRSATTEGGAYLLLLPSSL